MEYILNRNVFGDKQKEILSYLTNTYDSKLYFYFLTVI